MSELAGRDHFSQVAAARSAPGWTSPVRTRREATAAEFYSAMATRRWSEARRTGAFRILVLGEKAREVAEAVGLTKDGVSQAADQAYAAVEAWRLRQLGSADVEAAGLTGLVEGIQRLVVRTTAAAGAAGEGELQVALRKSALLLQSAADELRPHI
nr:TrfB-related DNA-binding protein [uncultured Pseudogulbenkiania sp.]